MMAGGVSYSGLHKWKSSGGSSTGGVGGVEGDGEVVEVESAVSVGPPEDWRGDGKEDRDGVEEIPITRWCGGRRHRKRVD